MTIKHAYDIIEQTNVVFDWRIAMKKLPDVEFEIMNLIWQTEGPVTSAELVEKLNSAAGGKTRRPQTVQTMLVRLENKGFLSSEKSGKERFYSTLISRQDYMKVETESFRSRFKKGSVSSLVKALYPDGELEEKDIAELKEWLDNL